MAVTIEQLLDEVNALRDARDAAAAAHDATVAAKDNVVNVTNVAQARIDAATAQFDLDTREAASQATAAEGNEAEKNADEDAKFNQLVADLQLFKDGQ